MKNEKVATTLKGRLEHVVGQLFDFFITKGADIVHDEIEFKRGKAIKDFCHVFFLGDRTEIFPHFL